MAAPDSSFGEAVFGPLVPGRACGACTACCFELVIDDPQMQKPQGQTCVHCIAEGCTIYPTRPQDCRTWFCAWRRLGELPESLRPDQSGFLACLVENHGAENPLQRLYVIVQWLDGKPIAKSEAADQMLATMRRRYLPVWVGSADRMALHFPRDEIALPLMRGETPTGPLAAEVEAWRLRIRPRRA